jgi:hypothetical protein
MIDLTPTNLNVNDLWIRENLAKAERYHALTRGEEAVQKQSVERPAIQMPRISVIRRLVQALPRPA